jgi:hypothetical protein
MWTPRSRLLRWVVKALEHATDVHITFGVIPLLRKRNQRIATEKLFDQLNRAEPRFIHVEDHPWDDQPAHQFSSNLPLQTHSWLEIQALLRLTPR